MDPWIGAQRAFAIKAFYENNDSAEGARREFRRHFNLGRQDRVQSARVIKTWISNLEETGSAMKKKPPGRERTVCTPKNFQALQDAVTRSPHRSIGRLSANLQSHSSSAQRMLVKDLQYHPYKLQIVQELKPNDAVVLAQFCNVMLQNINDNEEFVYGQWIINNWLHGLEPLWFHVVNVTLHIACSILFTRVAVRIAGLQTKFALLAGLIFAAHPVHTEAVSGIVGRADILACSIFLLSFLLYHDEELGKRKVTLSCCLAGLAMLAKETGLTVLLVNIAYDLYKSWPYVKRSILDGKRSEESVRFARRAAKVLVAMSVLLVLRVALLQGSLPKFSAQDNPSAFHPCPHVRLMTFCYLAVFNCWLLFCPTTLSHDWQMGSIPLVTSLADCRNIATCIFFGCCLLLAYRCFADFENHRHSPLVLGCLFLVIPFLPATNLLVTVGFVLAERVLYIPSLGGVLLVVYGAQLLYDSGILRQRAALICSIIILLFFSLRTIERNKDWSSREALIRAGIKALPQNAKMHYNLANFHRDSFQTQLAVLHYREALRLWPRYASAHNNLGTLMSDGEEAENHFQSAISIQPGHVNAHYNLGQVYRKANRSQEAVTMLERCIRLDSAYTPAYLLLAKLQPGPIAGRLLKHVTRLHPTNSDLLAHYADWLLQNYRVEEAILYYQRALKHQRDHQGALLGWAKSHLSRGKTYYLHFALSRWRAMKQQNENKSRIYSIVNTADLFIRSWDLYKQGQVTSQFHHSTTPSVLYQYDFAPVMEKGLDSESLRGIPQQRNPGSKR